MKTETPTRSRFVIDCLNNNPTVTYDQVVTQWTGKGYPKKDAPTIGIWYNAKSQWKKKPKKKIVVPENNKEPINRAKFVRDRLTENPQMTHEEVVKKWEEMLLPADQKPSIHTYSNVKVKMGRKKEAPRARLVPGRQPDADFLGQIEDKIDDVLLLAKQVGNSKIVESIRNLRRTVILETAE